MSLLVECIFRIKECFYVKRPYYFRDFYIELPSFHNLPLLKRLHPKYDRFLPALTEKISFDCAVIDVGANCGDTLAGMVESNRTLQYLCIEPDELFFNFLTSNLQLIKEHYKELEVYAVRSLVGKDVRSASLTGRNGTKKAVVGGGAMSSRELDDIVFEYATRPVALLKSDVDGFDYDVLNSAKKTIKSYMPIIFFECEYESESQRTGFYETISWINAAGYENWVLFDNFGEVVLRSNDVTQVFQLLDYIWKQNRKLTTRTIFYYDILAYSEKDRELVDSVLLDY